MTPTQLRAFAAVVRKGSVKAAAAELGVTEAAVSLHVGQLRKELGDQLFHRTAAGLAFTPGVLRIASSSLFAEHAAPGLIDLFVERAKDLDVELSIHRTSEFEDLLMTRTADVVIGPRLPDPGAGLAGTHFLNYQVIAVAHPEHPLTRLPLTGSLLREQTWLLGPSAAEDAGVIPFVLRRIGIPEEHQQIYQSHAAALEEAKRGRGIALPVSFAVAQDLKDQHLVRIGGPQLQAQGGWTMSALAGENTPSAVAELTRFAVTPRATQAMLRGRGVIHGRFKPAVHVTLWS